MNPPRGISLAESVVVVAITALVGGALLLAIRYFYVNNAYVFESTTAVYQARRGLTIALSDLREASYADDGNYPIASAATSSITFFSDIDADGGVERVRLWRVGTTLFKVVTNATGSPPTYTGQSSATSTIALHLRNGTSTPIFTYFDASGNQLATNTPVIADIAAIGITIHVDLNPNRAPQILPLSGRATLRNLKDE